MERFNGLVTMGVIPWSQGSLCVCVCVCVCVAGRGQGRDGSIFAFKGGLDLHVFKS